MLSPPRNDNCILKIDFKPYFYIMLLFSKDSILSQGQFKYNATMLIQVLCPKFVCNLNNYDQSL